MPMGMITFDVSHLNLMLNTGVKRRENDMHQKKNVSQLNFNLKGLLSVTPGRQCLSAAQLVLYGNYNGIKAERNVYMFLYFAFRLVLICALPGRSPNRNRVSSSSCNALGFVVISTCQQRLNYVCFNTSKSLNLATVRHLAANSNIPWVGGVADAPNALLYSLIAKP